MEREWSYQKINAVFGLNLLKYPYKYYYLRKKILAPENHCTRTVSVT